jgi:hypothetical protein
MAVRLSVLRASRPPFTSRKMPGTNFYQRLLKNSLKTQHEFQITFFLATCKSPLSFSSLSQLYRVSFAVYKSPHVCCECFACSGYISWAHVLLRLNIVRAGGLLITCLSKKVEYFSFCVMSQQGDPGGLIKTWGNISGSSTPSYRQNRTMWQSFFYLRTSFAILNRDCIPLSWDYSINYMYGW